MKRFFLMLLAVSSFAVCHQASAAIIITEVMSSSSHPGGSSNSDWFELTNNGTSAVNITGWSWDDDSNAPGTAGFGAITSIAAGQSIVVTQETLGNEAAWRMDWNVPAGSPIVNLGGSVPGFNANALGDTIYIYNAANVQVTSVSFGLATAGRTFAWDNQGNSLGLSTAGQGGAHVATFNGANGGAGPGTDVGSPGTAVTAVPEPSTLVALGAIGIGAIARKRMRRKA